MRCCPKEPSRKVPRSVHEDARDVARALGRTEAFEQSRHDRKRVEMLFAHSSASCGSVVFGYAARAAHKTSSHSQRFAQNLRRLAKLVARPPPVAPRAWRKRQIAYRCVQALVQPLQSHRS
jgi:hypothetical protein